MELFPIVDEMGNVIGSAGRQECHAHTFLLHPVVHLHVFNSRGQLYLQKRSTSKDIQPGKWDTSVGGHVDYGESIEKALRREAFEEWSMSQFLQLFITLYKFTSTCESKRVYAYKTIYDDPISPDPIEIDEGRFWEMKEIVDSIGKGIFTPNFEQEFQRLFIHIQ